MPDPDSEHPLEELQKQRCYSETNENPNTDSEFDRAYNAIRLSSVDGDVQFKNRQGETQNLSQPFLAAGETIPVEIKELLSAGTSQTIANILLLRA